MTDYREADVPDQQGRTALITGANTGIGFEAARVLAQRGARVLLACRSADRANDAIDAITRVAPSAELKWIALDLASLESVAAAAEEVNEEPHLDLLINNAGVMMPPKSATADGFELQFGVNHLGHFALTGRLLAALKYRPGARIVNVSSTAHRGGRIDYDDLGAERGYSRMGRYQMSKFANILFTYELQRRLAADGCPAIAVACHPGATDTELGRHIPLPIAIALLPIRLFMNATAEGALPTLMAATADGVQGGDYFGPTRWGELSHSARKVDTTPASKDADDAGRLWTLSEQLTGVVYGL